MHDDSAEVRNMHNLAVMIGNVSGQITALQAQLQQSHEGTNKRIDDLRGSVDRQTQALNKRIDDHKEAVDDRFTSIESDMRSTRNKTYAGSGAVTVLLNGFFKFLENWPS